MLIASSSSARNSAHWPCPSGTALVACAVSAAALCVGLAGCNRGSQGEPQPGSIFGKKSVPISVVVAGGDQTPIAFPSLAVFGSPKSDVEKAFRIARAKHEETMQACVRELARLRAEWRKVDREACEMREQVASEYNELLPKSDGGKYVTRDPLDGLVEARGEKTRADRKYTEDYQSRIKPLEDKLERIAQEESNVEASMNQLEQSFSETIFAALPQPKQTWKTDSLGKQVLQVPSSEPWYIWTTATRRVATSVVTQFKGAGRFESRADGYQTTFYRWLQLIPDSLTASGELCFDQTNLYDGSIARLLDTQNTDPKILRKQ